MVDDPTTNARAALRRDELGAGPDVPHLHAETGRGRGAPSVLLALPPGHAAALATLLHGLHDPRGPADLDVRLGRLAAAAPAGTAFAVAVGRSAWIFPSPRAGFRLRRGEATEPLDRPEVVTLRPGDRLDLVPVPSEGGEAEGAEAAWATLEMPDPVRRPRTDALPAAARSPRPPRPTRAPRAPRPGGGSGRARTVGIAVGLTATAGLAALWLGGGPGDPSDGSPGAPRAGLEDRVVGLLAQERSEPAGSPAPDQPVAEPAPRADGADVRARVDPAADAVAPREVALPPSPGPAPTWAFRTRAPITSSPLVVGDAVVFGCRDSTVYCLDTATGETRWAFAAGDGVGSSPTRAGDTVLVGTYAGRLLALGVADGALRWEADAGGRIVSRPCVVGDRVIVGSYAKAIHAWSLADGREAWRVRTADVVRASPEPVDRGGVVVGAGDGTLWCIDAANGKVRWRRGLGARVLAQAAWDPVSGRIFAGTADGTLAALDPADGAVQWRERLGSPINARPHPAGGWILAGTGKGRLVALDPADGSVAWEARADRGFDAEPLVLGDRVVAPSYDGVVHVLALADGRVLDRRPLDAEVFTSPAADGDHIYLGTLGGTFHALALP